VLIKNESARKLKAIGVRFSWDNNAPGPPKKSLILTLTMMTRGNDDPDQVAPGGYRIFTPIQAINQYLAQSLQNRRRGHFQTTPSVGPQTSSSLAETIQQGLNRLGIGSGV
jgi:hypothetical protein